MDIKYKYYYFGPFLMETKVDVGLYDVLCADLENIVALEQIDISKNLAGKIKNEFKFNSELIRKYESCLRPYVDLYIEKLICDWKGRNEVSSDKINQIRNNMRLDDIWANFQQKYEYNPIHRHTGDISFILYADVPEVIYDEGKHGNSYPNGSVSFFHGLDQNKDTSNNLLQESLKPVLNSSSLRPKNGDLFMFPSYLHHSVESFYSDVTRISVAGNFTMMPSQ